MKDTNGNNKSSMVILTIIGIATLLVAVIGATFAYFTVNIKGNPEDKNMEIQSVKLGTIVFKNEDKLIYENAVPGRPDPNDLANPVNNKISFTITNAEDSTATQKYRIMLNIKSNSFITDNVVYTLTQAPDGVGIAKNPPAEYSDVPKINSSNGTQYFSTLNCTDTGSNCVYHTFEGDSEPTKLGFIPASSTTKMKIGTATLGNFGAQDSWTFELWINEVGGDQPDDQGKRIEAYITIEPDDDKLSNEQGIIPAE